MTSPPAKDCRNCNRRRIRCDRSLPTCEKCKAKGLECPGYGVPLRWKPPVSTFPHRASATTPLDVQAVEPGCARGMKAAATSVAPAEQANEFDAAISTATVSQQLLRHYYTEIAPLMVWLDTEQNEYRRLVIPLAETHTALRLAILAIAAAHAPAELMTDANFSQRAYEITLLLITDGVRRLAGGDVDVQSPHNGDTIQGVLAAALILSNYSLLGSELNLAQVHLQAVRVLIKSIPLDGSGEQDLGRFLKNQAAIYDILVCTANFDAELIKGAILPDDDVFAPLLRLIHEIPMSSTNGCLSHTFPDLYDRFALAQSSTVLASASSLDRCSQDRKEDFLRLVQVFYHAGVLYACKRLGVKGNPMEEHHTIQLFEQFERFRHLDDILHNLAWPIFVAGISSWPNVERMWTVATLSRSVCESTRFGHYGNISAFHEELWTTDHHDWIQLAEEWKDRGQQIIPV